MEEYLTEEGLELLKLDEDPEYEVSNFFRENLIKVGKIIETDEFRKFANLDSNSARVAFILSLPEAHELPVGVEIQEKKDSYSAISFKNSGNTAFSLEHYPVAIEDYNHAALVAPKEGQRKKIPVHKCHFFIFLTMS